MDVKSELFEFCEYCIKGNKTVNFSRILERRQSVLFKEFIHNTDVPNNFVTFIFTGSRTKKVLSNAVPETFTDIE